VEEALLDRGAEPGAMVLVAGNHGCADTGSGPWLDAVAPDLAVLSVGAYNRHGCPDPEVLSRMTASGAALWRTDRDGPLRIHFPLHARYAPHSPWAVRLQPLDR
jgi:competence protein ComEC